MRYILILGMIVLGSLSSYSQSEPRKVEWNGKSYWVYPYRFNSQNDHYYTYDNQIGTDNNEREIVPYPGSLPDGDYIMYYNPISKYKKKMWFFHRRGEYYHDTTVVAVTFTLRNNQKQGLAQFYSSAMGMVENGNYLNDQKDGVWQKRGFHSFYSHFNELSQNDKNEFESGSILEYIHYKEGIKEGNYKSYMRISYDDKLNDSDTAQYALFSKGFYKLNKVAGTWFFYYKNKSLFKKFTISDSITEKQEKEIVYSYSTQRFNYHHWYEVYYSNGQLQNRILYDYGVKKQLDSGYYSNGKFSWLNTSKKIQGDSSEVLLTEYMRFDTLGRLDYHASFKDGKRLWLKTYFESRLCSESYDHDFYTDIKQQDTLLVSVIYYNCYSEKDAEVKTQISFYHPETGITLNRNLSYADNDYFDDVDDFEIKSDTASHIYYITEIDRQGAHQELEYHTYKHYYRGPYFSIYGSYTSEIDSTILFYNGKRFNGDFTQYHGRWKKKKGKVKGNDHHLKYFSYYYGGRGFTGTPSFGYNSYRLVISDYGYRGWRGRFHRKISNTTRGYYRNGLQEGKWTNENKKHGYLNEMNMYERGQLEGRQLSYSYVYADRWSNCVDIVDKKISKKKRLFRRYRYFLSSESNYQNGLLHGPQLSYYCNGQVSQKSYYENDLQNGELVVYNEDGHMTKKANYKSNFYDGKYMEWSVNKKIRYDFNYEEGLLVGDYKSYFFNGNISLEGQLNDGYKIGEWKTYFENGNIKFKDTYSIEDSTFLSFYSYYSNGSKMAEKNYHNLNSCLSMQYYPSGTLAAEGKIKRNSRIGIWNFYDEGGNLIRRINYEPGTILQTNEEGKTDTILHYGYYESWYNNGNKQTEAYVLKESTKFDCYQEVNITLQDLFYLNYWDKENVQTIKDKTGRLKSYHLTTGRPESEGEMINGMKNGYWRYWDPEGKLNGVGNFKNDLHEGRWLYGDLEGMHYLDDACFDITDPRVKEDMELKRKKLSITEIIYLKGKVIKETNFAVDLNK